MSIKCQCTWQAHAELRDDRNKLLEMLDVMVHDAKAGVLARIVKVALISHVPHAILRTTTPDLDRVCVVV